MSEENPIKSDGDVIVWYATRVNSVLSQIIDRPITFKTSSWDNQFSRGWNAAIEQMRLRLVEPILEKAERDNCVDCGDKINGIAVIYSKTPLPRIVRCPSCWDKRKKEMGIWAAGSIVYSK